MSESSAAIGFAKCEFRAAAAESLSLICTDEGPGHRFDEIARGECALGLVPLRRRIGVSTALRGMSPRPNGGVSGTSIDAEEAHFHFHDIRLVIYIGLATTASRLSPACHARRRRF